MGPIIAVAVLANTLKELTLENAVRHTSWVGFEPGTSASFVGPITLLLTTVMAASWLLHSCRNSVIKYFGIQVD